ncbi:MAG: hypothetical protein JWL81_446, partial [Verrucomicrobiales bacterium]|nr:hypothetical protein [Verrucomicrobiales bacterium]
HKIQTVYSVRYTRPTEDEHHPCVELLDPQGRTEILWKPARLFAIRKARPAKYEWHDSAIISVLREREVAKDLVAGIFAEELPGVNLLKGKDVYAKGRHLITLAKLSGAPAIHDWTCQKIGEFLGITKQAVSRRLRRMNDRIQATTGGRTSFRCVRTKTDPRKGKSALPPKASTPKGKAKKKL